jgi:hypothetical protein
MTDLTSQPDQSGARATRASSALEFCDADTPLRITACPDCGIVFALPLALYLDRVAAGGVVSCANGHPILLGRPKIADGDTLALSAHLVAELNQTRHELAQARGALLRAASPAPTAEVAPTPAEISRRVNLLTSRARGDGRRRSICHLCGKSLQSGSSFKRHLQRQHAAEIAALPAGAFL